MAQARQPGRSWQVQGRCLVSAVSPLPGERRPSRHPHPTFPRKQGRLGWGRAGGIAPAPRGIGGALGVLVRRLHGWRLCGYLQQMRTSRLAKLSLQVQIRRGKPTDLDALLELENQVFATDRMSRRSLRRLLASESAVAMVARAHRASMGVATRLFR